MEQMHFDGRTFVPARDGERLTGLWRRVFDVMGDGQWHSLPELARRCQGSETSVSARLRDFRKSRWGGHTVERRHIGAGVWEYRMEVQR